MKLSQSKIFVLITGVLITTQLLAACSPAVSIHANTESHPSTLNSAESAPKNDSLIVNQTNLKPKKIDPLVFQQAVRKLWEDHVTWTRVYIIAALADLPEADTAAQRLLQNQVDIGNAIKPFYGDQAGDQLTALLKEHILIAVDLLAAAKAGDTAKFEDANKHWYKNADEIAAFLSSANPDNWPLSEMQMMMKD